MPGVVVRANHHVEVIIARHADGEQTRGKAGRPGAARGDKQRPGLPRRTCGATGRNEIGS